MTTSRRDLLKTGVMASVGVGVSACATTSASMDRSANALADAVGAGVPEADAGAGITSRTVAAAEQLAGVSYTEAEREQLLLDIDGWIARAGRLRAFEKPNELHPATVFDPRLPGVEYREQENSLTRSGADAGPLPGDDTAIAFAPVWKQARWIESGQLTSSRLTEIYLDRIARHGDALECFVTVTPDVARREAARADALLAEGRYLGPLHGIPYGMKDIIDVKDIPATWGATPYRDRVAEADAAITVMLRDAGAVLLGKTTNGAIAYGDRWFDGVTRNPWNTEEGSSGSSAGSASATSAGLVSFGIGTETLGSIVSPSHRCGTTGLRPTFGRVSRRGAMALCWTLDKIGPICRSVEDTAIVLSAINGFDVHDPSSIDHGLDIDAGADVRGMRVGWNPAWFENATPADQAMLDAARDAGVELVEVSLPDLPYDTLLAAVEAESAAAFEHLTLSNEDDTLVWQDPPAWPNTWRRARFISAIDLINADRLRRRVMQEMNALFDTVDALIAPNFASGLLVITNYTGHPQLAIKSGYNDQPSRSIFGASAEGDTVNHRVPQTTSLWAPLFEEGRLVALGREIERRLGVSDDHPPEFHR